MADETKTASGTTRWQRGTEWIKRRAPTVSRGSTALLVAAFIASYDDIQDIITAGKAGKAVGLWDFVGVLVVMAFAAAHNFSTYTDDTHARNKLETAPPGVVPPVATGQTESEWLKSNLLPQPPAK